MGNDLTAASREHRKCVLARRFVSHLEITSLRRISSLTIAPGDPRYRNPSPGQQPEQGCAETVGGPKRQVSSVDAASNLPDLSFADVPIADSPEDLSTQ